MRLRKLYRKFCHACTTRTVRKSSNLYYKALLRVSLSKTKSLITELLWCTHRFSASPTTHTGRGWATSRTQRIVLADLRIELTHISHIAALITISAVMVRRSCSSLNYLKLRTNCKKITIQAIAQSNELSACHLSSWVRRLRKAPSLRSLPKNISTSIERIGVKKATAY